MSALPPPLPPPPHRPYAAPQPIVYLKAPVGRLARRIETFLVGYMAVTVMAIPVSLETARRARAFIADDRAAGRFDAALGTQGFLGVFSGALTLTVGVLTIIWMFRLARNHESMGRTGMTWSSGWAIAGWFCPPMLAIIPWLMFRELWKGSDLTVAPYDPAWKRAAVSPVITIWWVLYAVPPLVNAVLVIRKLRFGLSKVDSAHLYDVSAAQTITVHLLSLAAAGTYLVLVHRLTSRHRQLIGEV